MELTQYCGYKNNEGISRMQQDLQRHLKHTPNMFRSTAAKMGQVSVAIVGAGFAGLRCADVLLQHGFEVTILEARNRLGGRVAQSNHLGHLVDQGPNWIHGTDSNPIMTLAQRTATQLHSWDEKIYIFDSSGKALREEETDRYNELLWDDGALAAAFKYSNEYCNSIDPKKSLHDFIEEKAMVMFTDEPTDVAERKRKSFLQFTAMWGCYIGSPITRQSLKFFWLEEVIEGENLFVAETYHKILDAVSKPAREGADIRLDTEIVRIYGIDEKNEGGAKASVEIASGSILSFDEVVVTTPLSWLKNNKTAFEPAFPPRLSSAIDHISYGTLDKVYITFPSAFWDTANTKEPRPPVHSIDPQGKTPNITAKTAPLHQPPTKETFTRFASFIHWLHPTYALNTNPENWIQEGVNLAGVQPTCAHPTLLFYIQGPQSKHIGDLVKFSTSEQERDSKLKEFFEPYYSLLPNYDSSNPACIPKAVLATAWVNDKYAGYGSYSNFQVGLEAGDKDIETMRHGMPERHIWLAGEHTAPFVALGTSTGAYWSGEAVAHRIADAYQVERMK